jgi:hypothetical protein
MNANLASFQRLKAVVHAAPLVSNVKTLTVFAFLAQILLFHPLMEFVPVLGIPALTKLLTAKAA